MPRVDPVVVRELRLYLENEPKLFGEKKDVLRLLLSRKGGPADRLWLAWVRQGAAMFSREMGIDVPKEALLLLAKQISAQEESKLLRGDYDGIKLAYVENPVKKTATVNEALSHLALVKVAEASSALEGTSKKGSEVARQDLNRIVKKVASLAESPNFDSLEVQASLFDLVGKAETVYSHFSGETKVAAKQFRYPEGTMTEREWVERYADKVESTKVSWHSLMNRKKWNGLEGDAQTRYEEELKKKAEKPVFRAWKKDTFQEISKDTYTWAKAKGL